MENPVLCDKISKLQNGASSMSEERIAAREDEKPELENGRCEEKVDMEPACQTGEQQPSRAVAPEMMMARIGTCLESMEAQMRTTNQLLEQLVMEMKGVREDIKLNKAKEVHIATTRCDKLVAEQTRTNDLIEKALYAEPSPNLFSNSKDKHPHKAYLRVMLEDLEVMRRKLR